MNQVNFQNLQLAKWLGGAAVGALVMYMLDPDRGAPRRARSGEKLRELGRQTGDALDKVVHELGSRVGEAGATARNAASEAGATISHALGRGDGQARSDSMADEQYRPEAATRGDGAARSLVHAAEQLMQPARGGGWGGGMRGMALAGGGALGLYGMLSPRSPVGIVMGLAGLALLARGATNRPFSSMISSATHAHPVQYEKSVRIDAAPEQVYDMFANYENFPRFLSNVVEVRDLGNRRSHWIVKGPAGTHFSWNAVLTEHSRPRRLAWESEPGAEVVQSGSITFEPLRSGTRVTVRMAYTPPAGMVGNALASLLGSDPKRQMDDDLARMKSLVERGAIPKGGSPSSESESRFLH